MSLKLNILNFHPESNEAWGISLNLQRHKDCQIKKHDEDCY